MSAVPSMLNPHNMSPTEKTFIRLYVAAMHRDYDLLRSVLHLMDPAQQGMRSVVAAAKAAQSLREMQAEFDSTLHALAQKHKFRERKIATTPVVDELAELFSLSFFKIIKTAGSGYAKDDGWFSGEPDTWAQTLKGVFGAAHNKLPTVLAAYLQTLKKLLFDNKIAEFEKDHKSWEPPTIANKFSEYFLQADAQAEAYEEEWDDDDDDGFLEWFDNIGD